MLDDEKRGLFEYEKKKMRSAKRGSVYLLTDEYFASAEAKMFPVRERFHC